MESIKDYNEYKLEKRNAIIRDVDDNIIFQKEVYFPSCWSDQSVNIVSSKYFYDNENNLKDMIDRVVNTIMTWGKEQKSFGTDDKDLDDYENILKSMIIGQYFSFNSPVWFNLGTPNKQQGSACFINSLDDDMDSILELSKTEGKIFALGSGSGINVSNIRAEGEAVSGGGIASGPLSFMGIYDTVAGSIKSGGKTRRAAKMVLIDDRHPDLIIFIECKEKEEDKAKVLIAAGYDKSYLGEAYMTVNYQNANHSIRLSNEFMEAVENDEDWELRGRVDDSVNKTYKARDILMKIAKSTHKSGDPGVQFSGIINEWNTCKSSGTINASNPCSEYLFLDDTACNLGSLNLSKYIIYDFHYKFDTILFSDHVQVASKALDIIVGGSWYPTEQLRINSLKYRTIGLGYTNVGNMLLRLGCTYGSEESMNIMRYITSVMTHFSYFNGLNVDLENFTFEAYKLNRNDMTKVLYKHRDNYLESPYPNKCIMISDLWDIDYMISYIEKHGIRNAQTTVIAPTGTISFMMDAKTTGIEPMLSLIQFKKLADGGTLKIVDDSIGDVLKHLDYDKSDTNSILDYIENNNTVSGCIYLKEEHLDLFRCSLDKQNPILYQNHLNMLSAVQPHISGGISKTINVPNTTTVDEIYNMYLKAYKMGIKCVAIYRDGSKGDQPLSTEKENVEEFKKVEKLDNERMALIHKFKINGHKGYITLGINDDNTLHEVFVKMDKQNSTLGSMIDNFAKLFSISLQNGVSLEKLITKFKYSKFEPSGFTDNEKIRTCTSILDYIVRYLELKYYSENVIKVENVEMKKIETNNLDTEICTDCSNIAYRSGTCYICSVCGTTTGCA